MVSGHVRLFPTTLFIATCRIGAYPCREYGLFMAAISRAMVAHSSSRRMGLPRWMHWSSSHFKSSYLCTISDDILLEIGDANLRKS